MLEMNWIRRVLVVDDDAVVRKAIARLLVGAAARPGEPKPPSPVEGATFEVETAESCAAGMELVAAAIANGTPPALAFVDLRMPECSGLSFIKQLWARLPDTEVVLCTGSTDFEWADVPKQLGLSDRFMIIKKPFEPIEIRQAAVALTEKWMLRQQVKGQLAGLEVAANARSRELRHALEQLRREATEREQVEVELRHAQKLESVGRLAAGVAHEINTPIQFIGDSAHFLQEAWQDLTKLHDTVRLIVAELPVEQRDPALARLAAAEQTLDYEYLREEGPRAFARTFDGVQRVASIVRAMKEFAHPEGREKTLADLNRAIESTVTVAKNELKYVADVELDLGELPPVLCHLGDLNQVFLNLLVNAAHAIEDVVGKSGQKGTIRVCTRRDEGHVTVTISDTGTGIPEHARAKVFDPFFTTKEVGRGPGQGLAIARSVVVEKHGGALTFDTEPGRGTTFYVRIPVQQPGTSAEVSPS